MQDSVVSQRIQDAFVLLAVQNTPFLRAARQSIKPNYFGSQVTEDLIKLAYDYFDQFGEAPGNHFRDEAVRMLQSKPVDKAELYMTYLDRLQTMETPNTAYVISRINRFVQARELEKGAVRVVQLAQEGHFEQARGHMQSMLRAGIIKEEVGSKYFAADMPSYLLPDRSNERLIGIGMEPIDRRFQRGLCRTDFVCLLGGYKGKKSWGLIHCGCQAIMSGLKVLHITHELSLEDTEKRYDMMLGGFGGSLFHPVENVTIENINDEGETIAPDETIEVVTVKDAKRVLDNRKAVARLGGRLIIRKYPMGSCTMDEIVRYLDYLESFEGFIPDVVINDYIEKMQMPAGPHRRDYIDRAYIQSKGIADDRKLLMITASQVTREALRKKRIDQRDFAEDIRKLGNVDQVFAICQNEKQAKQGRMMMWVLANRHGPMDFGCQFNQNLDIGQFCLKSWSYRDSTDRSQGDQPTGESSA